MGWLKKVGQVALQIVVGIDTFGPIVKSVAPDKVDRAIDRIGDYTRQSADIIAYAEIMGQALGNVSGPDKLKAATPAMAQVILRSDAMIGKKIKDAALFTQGVTSITSGWADVLNSLDEKGV